MFYVIMLYVIVFVSMCVCRILITYLLTYLVRRACSANCKMQNSWTWKAACGSISPPGFSSVQSQVVQRHVLYEFIPSPRKPYDEFCIAVRVNVLALCYIHCSLLHFRVNA